MQSTSIRPENLRHSRALAYWNVSKCIPSILNAPVSFFSLSLGACEEKGELQSVYGSNVSNRNAPTESGRIVERSRAHPLEREAPEWWKASSTWTGAAESDIVQFALVTHNRTNSRAACALKLSRLCVGWMKRRKTLLSFNSSWLQRLRV